MISDLNKFKEKITDKKWIFFDFFGSIVNRKCTADEIKHIWALELEKAIKIKKDELYKIRRASESILQKRNIDSEFNYTELCKEIYLRISYIENTTALKYSLEEFEKISYEIEVQCECNVHYKIEKTCRAIKIAKDLNKYVGIISDFYLPEKAFKLFLSKQNLESYVDNIFVSCEYGANKHSGRLYQAVLNEINEMPESCLMVGNNMRSDVNQASLNHISAIFIKSKEESLKDNIQKELEEIKKISDSGINSYANYSFLLYRFIEKLTNFIINENTNKIYFLSREGQLLKRLFDKYTEIRYPGKFTSDYLYVSRKATYPATLADLNTERFNVLREFNSLSISDFLQNIGLGNHLNSEWLKDFDLNTRISNFFESDTFLKLSNTIEFEKTYNIERNQARKNLKEYLMSRGIDPTGTVYVVDVGWNGTIQNNLSSIIKNTVGCYIGLQPSALITVETQKKGFIYSGIPYPSRDFKIWSTNNTFLERLLTADHGATEGYININGKVTPQLKTYKSESNSYSMIKSVQEILFDKFTKLTLIFQNSPYDTEYYYDYFKRIHLYSLYNLNVAQIKLQHSLLSNQMQNFGNLRPAGNEIKETYSILKRSKEFIPKFKKLFNTELIRNTLISHKLYITCTLIFKGIYMYKRYIKK